MIGSSSSVLSPMIVVVIDFLLSLCFLVEYINADLSVDLKRDCFIVSVNQFLECTCTDDVPPVIKLDLAEAKKGLQLTS